MDRDDPQSAFWRSASGEAPHERASVAHRSTPVGADPGNCIGLEGGCGLCASTDVAPGAGDMSRSCDPPWDAENASRRPAVRARAERLPRNTKRAGQRSSSVNANRRGPRQLPRTRPAPRPAHGESRARARSAPSRALRPVRFDGRRSRRRRYEQIVRPTLGRGMDRDDPQFAFWRSASGEAPRERVGSA